MPTPCPQGSFTRQLQVGDALDTDKVQATYSDGVLLLTIPLSEAAQPRRIQIQHRGGQQQLPTSGGSVGTKSGDSGQQS